MSSRRPTPYYDQVGRKNTNKKHTLVAHQTPSNPTGRSSHGLNSSVVQCPKQPIPPVSLIAAPILPPGPPPLLPLPAIKRRLPKLPVHLVVRLAQPIPKVIPAAGPNLPPLHVLLEVLGAHPARVELGEEAHEALQLRLLLWCRRGRVGGCYRVEEGPCAPAEGLDVWGAVFWRGGGCGGFEGGLGLGGPRGEGGAGAAAGGEGGSG